LKKSDIRNKTVGSFNRSSLENGFKDLVVTTPKPKPVIDLKAQEEKKLKEAEKEKENEKEKKRGSKMNSPKRK